jgi:hypothetical protein
MVSENEYQLISLKHGYHVCLLENDTIGVYEPVKKILSKNTNNHDLIRLVIQRNQENVIGLKMMNGYYLSSKMDNQHVTVSKYFTEHESFKILSQSGEENMNSLFKHDGRIGIKNTKYDGYLSSLLIQKNEIEYFQVERMDWNKIKLKKNELYLKVNNNGQVKDGIC